MISATMTPRDSQFQTFCIHLLMCLVLRYKIDALSHTEAMDSLSSSCDYNRLSRLTGARRCCAITLGTELSAINLSIARAQRNFSVFSP
jgi:hypothetical protein